MRGRTFVRRRVVVAGLAAAALAGPAAAWGQGNALPSDNPARSQAFIFERTLRGAIEQAGQQLAKQVLLLVPELTLSTEEAIARGVKLDSYGFFFDVQAPSIQSTVMLWDMMARQRTRSAGPSRPVSSAGPIATEPMPGAPAAFDPDREYTANVRAALVDAMLDGSGVLNIGPEERLTIVVSGIDQPNPNPLYRVNSHKLILTIHGADLMDFRQGRLTREEVKQRIREERF
jgi:hypothetical protein